MADSITVNPDNSPYQVPSSSVVHDTVTIEPGGMLQFSAATTMTVANLVKNDAESD